MLAILFFIAAQPVMDPPIQPNYGHAEVTMGAWNESIIIREPHWIGSGRAEDGVYYVAWTHKQMGMVDCVGYYWFDNDGHLVGCWTRHHAHGSTNWWNASYLRIEEPEKRLMQWPER